MFEVRFLQSEKEVSEIDWFSRILEHRRDDRVYMQ